MTSAVGSWLLYLSGIVTIIFVCLKTIYNLYSHFIIYFQNAAVDYRRFGRWALVTGATDGIGKGIARELAKLGLSVVLVSRNSEKLQRTAREIESEFKVETQCVVTDFTLTDDISEEMTPSVYDGITNAIRDLEVGILVNNVGMTTTKLNPFLKCFDAKDNGKNVGEGNTNLVNCNVMSQIMITRIVLPEMVKRGKGLVINISSAAAQYVFPFGAVYSGSKKFNDHFSRALSFEYEDSGIVIQSLTPGLVDTNLARSVLTIPWFLMVPNFKTYARHALRSVGKVRVNHGYWLHALQMWLFSWIPESMNTFYINSIPVIRKLLRQNPNKVKDKDKKYQ